LISPFSTTGNLIIDSGGAVDIALFDDVAVAGTLTKRGGGVLTLDNTAGTMLLGDTTHRIEGGRVRAIGADPLGGVSNVILAGGGLEVALETNPGEGLAMHLKFDDGAGSSAFDSSGNGRSGTLTGFPVDDSQWVAGKDGGALIFDGTDDWVNVIGYQGVTGTTPRTLSAWIKDGLKDNAGIMSWGPNNTGEKWTFRTQIGNGELGAIRLEVSGGHQVGTTDLRDDQWHHVVAVFPDGGDNVDDILLYVDGVLEVNSSTQAQAVDTTFRDVWIGRDHNDTHYWQGLIDDVRIYDSALTADQILDVFNFIPPPPPLDLTHVTVAVEDNSFLTGNVGSGTSFGALSIADGKTLTVNGLGAVDFTGTTFGGTAAGVTANTPTRLGVINDGGVGVAITIGGTSQVVLDNNDANTLGATSMFDVAGGRLVVVAGPDATRHPIRSAGLALSGGGLAFTDPNGTAGDGATVTFDNAIEVTADSTLTAGRHAGGLIGPKTVVLGSAANGLTITSGTLGVSTTDGYTLHLDGPVSGAGGISFTGGSVAINTTGNTVGVVSVGSGAMVNGIGSNLVATDRYEFNPTLTIAGNLGAGADSGASVHIGLDNAVDGTVTLTGTNTYTGVTEIHRGVLRADQGAGLPVNAGFQFTSTARANLAVLATSGAILRTTVDGALTPPGSGEISWNGRGGFAAVGGDLTVLPNGGFVPLDWGSNTNGFNGQDIQFGAPEADGTVIMANRINLDGNSNRHIQVYTGSTAKFTGVISGGNTTKELRLNEAGGSGIFGGRLILEPATTNTYIADFEINEGFLRATIEGPVIGLSPTALVAFNGNSNARPAILETSGTLARNIGDGTDAPDEIRWNNHGGFAAWGGALTVTLEGGAELAWGDADSGFNGNYLMFGSDEADNVVTLTNNIDGGDGNRNIRTFDNPNSTADYAVLSGDFTNMRAFSVRGPR